MSTRPHVRWNFWVNFIEGVFGVVSWQLLTHGTVLPGLIGELVAVDGLLAAYEGRLVVLMSVVLPQVASIPGVVATGHFEGLTNRKALILGIGALGRLQLLAIALAAFLLPPAATRTLLAVLGVCLLIMRLAEGLVQPLWLDVIQRLIPAQLRGRLLGGRDFVASYVALGLMLLFPPLSRRMAFPTDYACLFLAVFALQVFSWIVFAQYRELPYREHRHEGPGRVRLLAALRVLRDDPVYRRLMIAIAIIASAHIAPIALFTTRATQTFRLVGLARAEFVSYGLAAGMVGYSIGILLAGLVADRRGYRPVLYGALSFLALAFGAVLLARSPLWCYAGLLLGGLFSGGTVLFWLNYPLEFAPAHRVPSYVALRMLVTIPPTFLSLLGGWIADRIGFEPVFALGITVVACGAVYFHFRVPPSARDLALLRPRPG